MVCSVRTAVPCGTALWRPAGGVLLLHGERDSRAPVGGSEAQSLSAGQRLPRLVPRCALWTCAPMRCRCWAGGCPWTPGNIKSTPTRSSARQRTRSSRRPCRTRARRGKLEFLCVLCVARGRARGSARLERDRLSTMSGGKAPHFARRRFAVWIHWSASN